ncbi:MAG: HPr family phosphocarrier protein [Lachnospiraceae bacterium]|nr:HPr family phosphocarrier protein [Lachnospiraceae bacterium]
MNYRDLKVTLSVDDERLSLAGFVQKANEYESAVYVETDGKKINSKSIMGMMSLGLLQDRPVRLIVNGNDEEEAMAGILEHLNIA